MRQDAILQIRCPARLKEALDLVAEAEGVSLSEWVRERLRRALDRAIRNLEE